MAELSQADEAKLEKWVAAKRSKNFGLADQIRAELEAKGIRAEQVRPHVWEPPGGREAVRLCNCAHNCAYVRDCVHMCAHV